MDLGDFVVVTHPGHPMKGARGKSSAGAGNIDPMISGTLFTCPAGCAAS